MIIRKAKLFFLGAMFISSIASAQSEKVDAVIGTAERVLDTGIRIYQIFKDGRGSSTYTPSEPISAVPVIDGAAVSPFELENGKSRIQEVALLNGSSYGGIVVYELIVKIDYQYGLTYNGAGKYLKDVTISPAKNSARGGYETTATVLYSGTSNLGTRENPIPRMKFTINYTVKSPTFIFGGDRNESAIIYVDGTGHVWIDNKRLSSIDWNDPEENDNLKPPLN